MRLETQQIMETDFVENVQENLMKTEMIVCEICGKTVSRLDYERHLRTHREKRVEVCKICLKAFTSKYSFQYKLV